nr:translation initiation factor IF-2 N-terminal domain-containing protein [Nocardioidaceae bacterium]
MAKAAKARVHELAKEFGVTSKVVLAALNDMGEYVKSPSSTIEPPVVAKLTTAHGETWRAETAAKAAKKAAKKAPAKKTTDDVVEMPAGTETSHGSPAITERVEPEIRPTAPSVESVPVVETVPPVESAPVVETVARHDGGLMPLQPATPAASAAPSTAARPGPRPGAPRPGNNPFSSTQGMQRSGSGQMPPRPPAGRTDRPGPGAGDVRSTRPGSVPGAPRPNPAMMPKQSDRMSPSGPGGRSRPAPGARGGPGSGPGGARGGTGAPARGGRGGYSGGPSGAPSGGLPASGGRPVGRNQRGQTQGAFGRPGGPSRRGRKSKRARRQEYEQMQAPSVGGVRVRKGEGETVRLSRGASLTDFAEKVGVDAASLVQVLFALGEMVTATQ